MTPVQDAGLGSLFWSTDLYLACAPDPLRIAGLALVFPQIGAEPYDVGDIIDGAGVDEERLARVLRVRDRIREQDVDRIGVRPVAANPIQVSLPPYADRALRSAQEIGQVFGLDQTPKVPRLSLHPASLTERYPSCNAGVSSIDSIETEVLHSPNQDWSKSDPAQSRAHQPGQ